MTFRRDVGPICMSTVTSADGTTIGYEAYGQGPTVVFIGGATQHRAIDSRTTELAEELGKAGYTAIDYDRRGRGESTDVTPWALAREVEDLQALIEATGGPAALYTSSSGATIALEAARWKPHLVSKLFLYEPPFFRGNDGGAHVQALRELIADNQLEAAMRYNLTRVIRLPEEAVDGMAHEPWWPAMVAVAPTLVYDLAAVDDVNLDPDWDARWASVTVPTAVVSGDQTFPGMVEAADDVARSIPKARRLTLAGQGHGPATEAVLPVLREFLGA